MRVKNCISILSIIGFMIFHIMRTEDGSRDVGEEPS
jgi:hypothetical protein